MQTKNSIKGFLGFSLAIAGLVLFLMLMNWLPRIAQKDTLRQYTSVEAVKASLNIREIYVPSYFPQNIAWPPSTILAQGSPFPAVVMEFRNPVSGEIVLLLSQSQGGPSPAAHALELPVVKETVHLALKGRKAVLVVGECPKDEPCSRITWQEGDYSVSAFMKAPPFELTRIAESMLP